MTSREMTAIVQNQLAADLNCSAADLSGEKDRIVFVESKENAGRRPFPRGEQHFEMLSMGRTIIVSATPELLDRVKPLLDGADRDEAYSMPFVYGHTLCYLPDLTAIRPLTPPTGFAYELIEQERIPGLYQLEGFHNALQYDVQHLRPDVLATLARSGDRIVGMAGASADCACMWQVGMDVLPQYRNNGLAAYLVNRLTLEILSRGIVPYYSTASSNIASQRTAHRAGYYPAWVSVYQGKFDGLTTSPTG